MTGRAQSNQLITALMEKMFLRLTSNGILEDHWRRLCSELRKFGANAHEVGLPETHALSLITQADEHIRGVAYGSFHCINCADKRTGRGAIFATDRRLLLVAASALTITHKDLPYNRILATRKSLAEHSQGLILRTEDCSIEFSAKDNNVIITLLRDTLPQSPQKVGDLIRKLQRIPA